MYALITLIKWQRPYALFVNGRKSLLLVFLLAYGFLAQAQHFDWARSTGDTGIGECVAYATTADAAGNIYTTGYFSGTVDFDPGSGVSNLYAGSYSTAVFIQKLDASGNLLWAKMITGDGNNDGRSIATDSSGYVYILGTFEGDSADFDSGPGVFTFYTVGAANNMFVLKLDSAGNFIWVKAGEQWPSHIICDKYANIYVTGWFNSAADFDPGSGVFMMSGNPGTTCGFIQKLDSAGNFLWAKSTGSYVSSGAGSVSNSIALDGMNNIYSIGGFHGTVDFDPGPATFNMLDTGGGIYVSKLDSAGNFLWATSFGSHTTGGSSIAINANAFAVDVLGSIYFTGSFYGAIDIYPGPGTFILNSIPASIYSNSFVEKLNTNGDFVWGKQLAATDVLESHALMIGEAGTIYSAGRFTGVADLDPGPGTFFASTMDSSAGSCYYIQKLDSNGNFINAFQNTGYLNTQANSIAMDNKKNIILAGALNGTFDFDPGPGVVSLSSPMYTPTLYYDAMYVTRFDQSTTGSDTATSCGSYTLNGHTYTASGIYHDTLVSSIGSDSLLSLSLTVQPLPPVASVTGSDSICIGSVETLADAISGGTWSASNAIVNMAGPAATGITPGIDTISYSVIDMNTGCTNKASFIITVDTCYASGVKGVANNTLDVSISPNPNPGLFSLFFSSDQYGQLQVSISDMLGKEVDKFFISANKETPVILNQPSGVYLLTATAGNTRITKKIILAK